MFDFDSFYHDDIKTATGHWKGFPEYNFIGGHNDASMVSGSLKLNEGYQGAELSFPRQHFTNRHVPRGVMLMWPGQVTHPHVCEPLEEGVKYSLTLWTKRFTQDT